MALRRYQQKAGNAAKMQRRSTQQLTSLARTFQRHRASSVSLPAPVGGWNKRDSLADMKEDDAVTLTNLFPGTTSCVLRSGFSQHSTGYSTQVETLISYSGAATNKLKAISGGSVYDATAGGAIGAAELSGLSNSRWQYINVTTAGGNFIEMCNGADAVYTYDGTRHGPTRAATLPALRHRPLAISTFSRTASGSFRRTRLRRGICPRSQSPAQQRR